MYGHSSSTSSRFHISVRLLNGAVFFSSVKLYPFPSKFLYLNVLQKCVFIPLASCSIHVILCSLVSSCSAIHCPINNLSTLDTPSQNSVIVNVCVRLSYSILIFPDCHHLIASLKNRLFILIFLISRPFGSLYRSILITSIVIRATFTLPSFTVGLGLSSVPVHT